MAPPEPYTNLRLKSTSTTITNRTVTMASTPYAATTSTEPTPRTNVGKCNVTDHKNVTCIVVEMAIKINIMYTAADMVSTKT
jgi:hypothetical protein